MVQMLALLALSLVRSHFFHSQFPIAVNLIYPSPFIRSLGWTIQGLGGDSSAV